MTTPNLRRTLRSNRFRARVLARYDWMFPTRHNSFGGPLNGQPVRQQICRDLLGQMRPMGVIECGGFRGCTTAFLRSITGASVWSIEYERRYAEFLRIKFDLDPMVSVIEASSVDALRELASGNRVPRSRCFFYLDAHTKHESRAVEELAIVASFWTDSVVMIDDVRIPDDPGYGYDLYTRGGEVRLEDIRRAAPHQFVAAPSAPATAEGGARRGCFVVLPVSWREGIAGVGLREIAAPLDHTGR